MAFYEKQPFIQPLYQLVSEVMRGDVRVPRFQRAGTQDTWSPDQRGDLLDSLYRGYPVGTILLWSTNDTITTIDEVGGYKIPRREDGTTLRLLLDGHQRLSTLVQILGAGLEADIERSGKKDEVDNNERWFFDLNGNDQQSRERFILLKPNVNPDDAQLPIDILLNRFKLNKWIRDHRDLTDEQIKDVDSLRDRLREYQIPVAVLVADSLDEATVSFKRINSSGTPMDDFNMVAALAFQNNFDLRDVFESAKIKLLADFGKWQDTPDLDLLRICAGILDDKPANIKVENLAKKLDQKLIDKAIGGAAKASQLLTLCGVHGPEALPYSWQLITLAIVLEKEGINTESENTKKAVEKWFWLTTYGEVFAGVNSAIYKRSSEALKEMLSGNGYEKMDRDITKKVRPVQKFDFRAVRSKACALLMARQYDDGHLDGEAHKAFATGRTAMQPLSKDGKRSNWWDLAIVPTELVKVRDVLRRKEQGSANAEDNDILYRLGMVNTSDANITINDMLLARKALFLGLEKTFVEELGLDWVE
ncbi:DUF262 domain-containing protein [Thiothrix subterranea]|uniref:DUF262 domain-containing protein n=1 Tax=Thiothrix subterranea TaxID=2735563 RepID=UPI00192ADAAD|nr:DUF262 domain-containing protein [Thiothrix subterranea]QQZ30663.1 DUF262 domain-containing protein [Thiothrix subterranea]